MKRGIVVAIFALCVFFLFSIFWMVIDDRHQTELGTAYGCGKIAGRYLESPPEDPLDAEERPWCVRYHQLWEIK